MEYRCGGGNPYIPKRRGQGRRNDGPPRGGRNYGARGGRNYGARGGRNGCEGPFENNPTAQFIPGSDARPEEVFTYPFIMDDETVEYITENEKVMFIIRGPSGTGKTTLSAMLHDKYSQSVVCSADSYFDQAFGDKVRSRETLRESHNFCQRRVASECQNGTHPVIVQNTHMRKWEMKPYLDLATKHGYNIIMAVTLRKFNVTPKILAQSNKKGLTEEYFRMRLSQWEECFPIYTGWFLGSDDATFVYSEVKDYLEILLRDSKFCNEMDAFCTDDIWMKFNVENPLFCIATHTESGKHKYQQDYYLSDAVHNVYGKYFSLEIQGLVVTEKEIWLPVILTTEMKKLCLDFDEERAGNAEASNDVDDLFGAMSAFDIGKGTRSSSDSTLFWSIKSCSKGSTCKIGNWEDDELVNIQHISFMKVGNLANKKSKKSSVVPINDLADKFFSTVRNPDGFISNAEFREFSDDTKYCRLPNNTWFVKFHEKISVGSFFGGLYDF